MKKGDCMKNTKNTIVIILGLFFGFLEGYLPIFCWVLLIMNLILLIFFKEGLMRKFIAFSLISFFIGYLTSCAVIMERADSSSKDFNKKIEGIK